MKGFRRGVSDIDRMPFFALISSDSMSTGEPFASNRIRKLVEGVVSISGPFDVCLTLGSWNRMRGPVVPRRVGPSTSCSSRPRRSRDASSGFRSNRRVWALAVPPSASRQTSATRRSPESRRIPAIWRPSIHGGSSPGSPGRCGRQVSRFSGISQSREAVVGPAPAARLGRVCLPVGPLRAAGRRRSDSRNGASTVSRSTICCSGTRSPRAGAFTSTWRGTARRGWPGSRPPTPPRAGLSRWR